MKAKQHTMSVYYSAYKSISNFSFLVKKHQEIFIFFASFQHFSQFAFSFFERTDKKGSDIVAPKKYFSKITHSFCASTPPNTRN